MPAPLILSVQTGPVSPVGPDKVPSGFVKQARRDAVRVTLQGVDGDKQADLTVHG